MSQAAERAATDSYLLDTHIWFWHLTGSDRLPDKLRRAIDAANDLWLSPVSVWELGMLVERGRISIQGGFRDWVTEAAQRFPLADAALTREVALVSADVVLPHRDPADRFLAASAVVYELTLVTVDRRLTRAPWLATRST